MNALKIAAASGAIALGLIGAGAAPATAIPNDGTGTCNGIEKLQLDRGNLYQSFVDISAQHMHAMEMYWDGPGDQQQYWYEQAAALRAEAWRTYSWIEAYDLLIASCA